MSLLFRIAISADSISRRSAEPCRLWIRESFQGSAAAEDFKKIGEYYYTLYANGGEVAPEVLSLCVEAKKHYDTIAEYEEEIERIKTDDDEKPAVLTCPICGITVEPGTKFCPACGQKIEA